MKKILVLAIMILAVKALTAQTVESLYGKATDFAYKGKLDSAFLVMNSIDKSVLKTDMQLADYHGVYMIIYDMLADTSFAEEAKFYTERAKELYMGLNDSVSLPTVFVALQHLAINNKDFQKSLQYAKERLKWTSKFDYNEVQRAQNQLVTSYLAVDSVKEAERMLPLMQEGYVKHDALSLYYWKTNQFKKAIREYQTIINLGTDDSVRTYKRIAQCFDSLGIKDSSLVYQQLMWRAKYNSKMIEEKQDLQRLNIIHNVKEVKEEISQQKAKEKFYFGIGVIILLSLLGALYSYKKLKNRNVIIEKSKAVIESKNKEIHESMQYAFGIQQTIMPKLEEVENENVEILFKAKDIVSGDFYWSKNDEYYAACDCTGHGVPGALMSIINSEILTIAYQKVESPAEILTAANTMLNHKMKSFERKDGMDVALVKVDRDKMLLHYAGANRNIFIIRSIELIELKCNKSSIGGDTEAGHKFLGETINLEKGDVVYLTTDGYIDQFGGEKDKKFGSKSFKELVSLTPDKDTLLNVHNSWKGETEQTDDICVIKITI